MIRRGPDAATQLGRALIAQAARAGCPIAIEEARAQAWHSATFGGARHAITVSASTSARLAEWLNGIGDAEFDLAGHLVADIAVESIRAGNGTCRVVVGALTLDEA